MPKASLWSTSEDWRKGEGHPEHIQAACDDVAGGIWKLPPGEISRQEAESQTLPPPDTFGRGNSDDTVLPGKG